MEVLQGRRQHLSGGMKNSKPPLFRVTSNQKIIVTREGNVNPRRQYRPWRQANN
jgi:hypothetical protein